ncbi:DUF6011 domain-containing protein [Gordonia aichiensis]|uniref:Uncharacterized protein n=1 Tax=Gordonia aichiensis NBRC 108223 TaxID=1220583 RepID=L7KKC5_9ACTN|nr:DUF6011 domain-containing protein [Gordonia aichiensis]GAC49034.1 hypothetical protein GOACH_09_00130 [Gordonia aichiensis NBRC 108223]
MIAKKNPGGRAGESQAVEWVRDYLDYSEPLTTEERSEVAAVSVVVELGYRPAVQCTSCGSWLVAPKSVALHRGPVCRSKDGDA